MKKNDFFFKTALHIVIMGMPTCKGSSNTPLHMGQTNSSSTSPWKRLSSYPILPELEIKLNKKYKFLGINFDKAEFHLMYMYFQTLGTLNMLHSGTGVLKKKVFGLPNQNYISAQTKFSDARGFRSAVNNEHLCMNHIDAAMCIPLN